MASDLGLDPSDPLNLLINGPQNGDSPMESSSSSQGDNDSTPDWTQLSSLWGDNILDAPGSSMKGYSDIMDFGDLNGMSMDMDFNPSISIDPSALHFDPLKMNPGMHYYGNAFPLNTDLASQFPFTFQSPVDGNSFSSSSSISSLSPPLSNKERRLSVTSTSSSGASYSPPESSPSPSVTGYVSDAGQSQVSTEQQPQAIPQEIEPQLKRESISNSTFPSVLASDLAAELAQRVMQSAGVMLALPTNTAQIPEHVVNQQAPAAPQITKLPIPRLQRHTSFKSTSSGPSSAASTPPPSTPPLSINSNAAALPRLTINPNVTPALSTDPSSSATPTTAAPSIRPKTSHTTIERRYRTNLNARIQSLRMAVPALRVLEDREGGNGKKIKKNVKGGIPIKGTPEAEDEVDVIDERGFVDGVKVARKCSKANVLGKAVEYIRVLKKRETRLKAEQAGLKMLVGGLVGGPALLREWEREWRERFGGEEKDEVEGEPDVDGDDEDSDEEDEDEVGRKRKRNKITGAAQVKKEDVKPVKKPVPAPVVTADGVVPEKRKRGRPRKVVPPPVPAAAPVPLAVPQPKAEPTSPLAAPQEDAQMHPPPGEWSQVQQPQQYLLAVFALFSFFNSPFTSPSSSPSVHHHSGKVLTPIQPPLALAPEIVSQFSPPSPSSLAGSWGWKEWVQMFHLLVSVLVLGSFAATWIGASARRKVSVKKVSAAVVKNVVRASDGKEIDWVKKAEECAIAGDEDDTSLYTRYQIYRAISGPRVPVSQRATLALVMYNTSGLFGTFARAKARSIWDMTKSSLEMVQRKAGLPKPKLAEKLVLEELDVTSAAACLQDQTESVDSSYGPIEILAAQLVRERVKKHLSALFVDTVLGNEEELDEEQKLTNEGALRRTIDTAKELNGQISELGRLLERVWRTPSAVSLADIPGEDEDTKALFTALVLYPRVFMLDATPRPESALLSPPPSPKSKTEGGAVMELRRALGSRVFESEELEDARDRVVDLVVDSERRCRSWSP